MGVAGQKRAEAGPDAGAPGSPFDGGALVVGRLEVRGNRTCRKRRIPGSWYREADFVGPNRRAPISASAIRSLHNTLKVKGEVC